ncbi:MAG TPA: hypothetical protein VLC46_22170 [Thermoanaerobaculia bacterium]|jgi:hypothetical protein|nr:hypothetical protein [Thermoanaerobaculia bacterium]
MASRHQIEQRFDASRTIGWPSLQPYAFQNSGFCTVWGSGVGSRRRDRWPRGHLLYDTRLPTPDPRNITSVEQSR